MRYLLSQRAASTVAASAGGTSSHRRVFDPQSGFTQIFPHGICNNLVVLLILATTR
jgi:hypothetical protein